MNSPRVAIIGSGPSAYYAAEELLKSGVAVDLLDRLPTPFGLVRAGVAPDHPKIKSITALFERISQHPALRFYGNVEVGRDVALPELASIYDAVVLACGAPADASLNIPGEALAGSHAAGAVVAWYNGHPDCRDYNICFDTERAVIVGNGNVALDVARILLTPVDQLRKTDIAEHALEALSRSRIKHIHIIGRRGPVQTSFAPQELRETINIPGCDIFIASQELELEQPCLDEMNDPKRDAAKRNIRLLQEAASRVPLGSARSLHFEFRLSPAEISGENKVEAIAMTRNQLDGAAGSRVARPTDQAVSIECGMVIRSVGFRAKPMAGVPFDARRGVVPNLAGRVLCDGVALPGLFVTGWMKRGSNGVIGTNRACGVETARSILADLSAMPLKAEPANTLAALLAERKHDVVGYDGWRSIDAVEREIGLPKGKPREKLTRISDLLAASRTMLPSHG